MLTSTQPGLLLGKKKFSSFPSGWIYLSTTGGILVSAIGEANAGGSDARPFFGDWRSWTTPQFEADVIRASEERGIALGIQKTFYDLICRGSGI